MNLLIGWLIEMFIVLIDKPGTRMEEKPFKTREEAQSFKKAYLETDPGSTVCILEQIRISSGYR